MKVNPPLVPNPEGRQGGCTEMTLTGGQHDEVDVCALARKLPNAFQNLIPGG